MDVIKEIRKAYVSVTAAVGIPLSDMFLPDTDTTPIYAVITGQDDSEVANKCGNSHSSGVTIEVVMRTNRNDSAVPRDDYAAQLISAIYGIQFYLPANFQIIQTLKSNDSTVEGFTEVFKIYKRIVQFNHTIKIY